MLVSMILIGGIYVILTAPTEKMTNNQKQLQVQLNKNTISLEQKKQSSSILETDSHDTSKLEQLGSITAIGDSVMLGAAPSMQKLIPNCAVEAKVSRQVRDAKEIVKELNEHGELGDIVIIGLGTNGTFNKSVGQKLLDTLGTDRKIYWITSYGKFLGWQEDVNAMIRKLAEKNKNLNIVDWASIAPEHPEWFYDDGLHLNSKGQVGYAEYIAEKLSKTQ